MVLGCHPRALIRVLTLTGEALTIPAQIGRRPSDENSWQAGRGVGHLFGLENRKSRWLMAEKALANKSAGDD
jgi:hypothetical protein